MVKYFEILTLHFIFIFVIFIIFFIIKYTQVVKFLCMIFTNINKICMVMENTFGVYKAFFLNYFFIFTRIIFLIG